MTVSSKVRAPVALISLLVVIGGLVWYVNQRDRMSNNKDDSIHQLPEGSTPASEPVQNANSSSLPPKSLFDDIERYRGAPDYAAKCAIAKEVAFSRTHLWESCALRLHLSDGGSALAHFASIYFHRGPEQKQELISLLQSDDLDVLRGLLSLLRDTCGDLDANGAELSGKRLGGADLLPHISRISTRHPELELDVVAALSEYGGLAKSEVDTMLRIVLSPDDRVSFLARLYLTDVDDELVKQLGLNDEDTMARPLTDNQRDKILGYLKAQGKALTAGPQNAADSGVSCKSLYGDIVRYSSAKDAAARVVIARGVASTQSNLLESCALRASNDTAPSLHQWALAHFVSAYVARGEQQKQELYALLHSRDTELILGMLWLLGTTRDLDANGELDGDKPLGGSEMPPHLSRIAKDHPDLAGVAAITLGDYGPLAKGETATLLRVVLSDRESDSQEAKRALSSIDFDGVYSKFSLDPDQPLTKEQRTAIEAYLQLHGGK